MAKTKIEIIKESQAKTPAPWKFDAQDFVVWNRKQIYTDSPRTAQGEFYRLTLEYNDATAGQIPAARIHRYTPCDPAKLDGLYRVVNVFKVAAGVTQPRRNFNVLLKLANTIDIESLFLQAIAADTGKTYNDISDFFPPEPLEETQPEAQPTDTATEQTAEPAEAPTETTQSHTEPLSDAFLNELEKTITETLEKTDLNKIIEDYHKTPEAQQAAAELDRLKTIKGVFEGTITPTATEDAQSAETSGAAETAAQDHETATEPDPDNYFIENKETGKIELHFEKTVYMSLSDRQKTDIKHNFLFSRRSGAWISRRKFPNLSIPRRVAESLNLYNAGTEGERLSFAEQQERKAEKAEHRADRMDARAEKAADRAETLQAPINRMHGDIAFFTQPNINSSAGRAFTRQRNRMWAAYDRGIEEFRKSEYYKERAETARATAAQAKAPSKDFCQRRIDDAEKTIRAQKRNISHYESIMQDIEAGKNPTTWTGRPYDPEKINKWIEDANDIIEEAAGKIAYYDALIQAQGGIINPDTLNPGDLVKVKRWGTVKIKSKGAKNFRFLFTLPHMTYANGEPMQGTAAYAEIVEKIS